MNKIISVNIFFLTFFLTLLNSNGPFISYTKETQKSDSGAKENFYFKDNDWTEQKLSSMTLREKIAQMIISNSDGYTLDEGSKEFNRLRNLIEQEKIGGLIFFKGNSEQEAGLINRLQSLSATPLLISADFERGTRMRLDDGSLFPLKS